MPIGISLGSSEEELIHFGAVRMRVIGSGSLQMSLSSLDQVTSVDLVPFTLAATTDREPTRLSNFITQRASLRVGTTEKDEFFNINRIIIFAKPVYSSFPG